MQQGSVEQQKRPLDSFFTALAVILFLGGFYCAGSNSSFFAGLSGYSRFGIAIVSLLVSAMALWPTSHRYYLLALFRGARIEMRKVRWPTKEEATKSTLVVLALVALFAIVLSIFDWILVKIVEALL